MTATCEKQLDVSHRKPQGSHSSANPRSSSNVDLLPRYASLYLTAKTTLDFLLALVLFVLTLPLTLVAMLLVKLTSPGPAIYSQIRVGRNAKPFRIYKIRTMANNCEKQSGAQWSQPGDARITPLGRWLRKTHIDELPQLWNVLRGDMSLIGPRPERPEFTPTLEKTIPHYRKRLQVRPGVTGLAQVQLAPDSDMESVRVKLAYDLQYIHSLNFWLDVRIYWATLFKILGFQYGSLQKIFGFPAMAEVEAFYSSLDQQARSLNGSHAHVASAVNGQANSSDLLLSATSTPSVT